ncbi:Ppx/GppA phosphatase family protein [Nakamurella endophytica]|uniref:Exopolyphosphatase n=1 Tax=Nakamurella endophytica TaxID=1748367 RepID=A0A917SMK4_9ACTN|nr:Ppx/GppA phosphatase family protein [Nakamurella endophytica]GGL87179.1 exopolyphosphatase [Nakamurella endophytica]
MTDREPARGTGGPTRVAAIDCGTNSIRLLVADVRTGQGRLARLVDVHREMRVVRLGEGVDATGRLSPGALDRTWHALAEYAAVLRGLGAVRVRMAATSATRDAQNRTDFVAMVRGVLGQDPEVITGAEEAELSFRGAVGDLLPDRGPFLVADIGGGSTELVVGRLRADAGGDGPAVEVTGRASLDIGCVRMTERVLRGDPPTPDEVAAARTWARETLASGLDGLPLAGVHRFVAVSGTATTVAAAALRLPRYDADRIHLSRIPVADVHRVAADLLRQPRAQRAVHGYMHPGRVDVIGSGALILSTLTDLVAARTSVDEVTVSEHDILDGLALSLA